MTELTVKRPAPRAWTSPTMASAHHITRLSQSDFVEFPATTTLGIEGTLTSVFIRRAEDMVEFEIHSARSGDKRRIKSILEKSASPIAQVLFLPPAWDSFQGRRVTTDAAQAATQLLLEILEEDTPLPAIVPGSDGSVQLEWHLPKGEIEINLESGRRGLVFWSHSGAEWERELADVRADIPGLVRQLTRS